MAIEQQIIFLCSKKKKNNILFLCLGKLLIKLITSYLEKKLKIKVPDS